MKVTENSWQFGFLRFGLGKKNTHEYVLMVTIHNFSFVAYIPDLFVSKWVIGFGMETSFRCGYDAPYRQYILLARILGFGISLGYKTEEEK